MCSSHAFEIRGLRVCLQFVCFVDTSQQPIRHARSSGRTLNRKYQQKIPNSTISSHLFGAKGGTSSSFFSVKLLAKKWVECEILFFFVWPSLWPAWFILCDLLQAQNVMPGLLSLRNFSFKAHYHTMLKNVYWFSRSGFQT